MRHNPGLLQRRAAQTWTEADKWITANKDRPFFAWVHFYDPHHPYDPPEPYKSRYARVPYDGEIAYTDEVIGSIRDRLRQLGLEDRTLLFLTADHGEALGDHRETTHGILVYESTMRVPFIVRLPRGRPRTIEGIVRHTDIAPTILDWLGLAVPPQMQGKSLGPLIDGRETEGRLAYGETRFPALHYGWSPLFSVTSRRFHFIRAPRPELYDRVEDPGETRNLYASRPVTAQDMEQQLTAIVAAAVKGASGERQTVDAETEDKLRALGYLGVSFQNPEAMASTKTIDPKDKVHLHEYLGLAQGAMQERKDDVARSHLEKLLAEDANMTEAHYMLGVLAVRARDYEKAVVQFRRVVDAQPEHIKGLYNLGTTLQALRRHDEAEKAYLAALEIDKAHMPSIVHLAHLYQQTGRRERGRQYFVKAQGMYEELLGKTDQPARKAETYARLAELVFKAGDPRRAEECLRAALALDPSRPTLHYNLALVLEAKGDVMGAIDSYLDELEITPENFRAHRGLGVLLAQQGEVGEALAALERSLTLEPDDPETYYRVAEILAREGGNPAEARRFASRAVEIAPRFVEARALLDRLERSPSRAPARAGGPFPNPKR